MKFEPIYNSHLHEVNLEHFDSIPDFIIKILLKYKKNNKIWNHQNLKRLSELWISNPE